MTWSSAAAEATRIAATWTSGAGPAAAPGGAVLLFDRDGIRHSACGGLAQLELGIPFTAETRVRYASISKHFLAGLALGLPGRIGPDDPLGRHLPQLQPALGAVRVGNALGMTGGLPDLMDTAWALGVPITATQGRDALLRFAATLDGLNSPENTAISYSNTGYRLVQTALDAMGMPLEASLRQRFFDPLGLGIVLPEDWGVPVPGLASGYYGDNGEWRRGAYGMHFSGSGGLVGSAVDLAGWAMALLRGAPPTEGLLDGLSARRHLADGTPTEYGLGLARHRLGAATLLGHGGSLPGYKNHFLLDPARGAGVVVLSNREDTPALGSALRVMAALADEALPRPAAGLLPDGRFADAAGGPYWLDSSGSQVTWLGAQESLFDRGDGWAVSLNAHMAIRLRRDGAGISGSIGHASVRLLPVPPNAALAGAEGEWHCAAQGARFSVANGAVTMGSGPLRTAMPMQPLGGGRALIQRSEGAWTQTPCLLFTADTCRVVTNRSRMLVFDRVG